MDIEKRILLIREQRVMLDSDLARLYGVKTEVLNQAVKRNKARFPEDFMFQLTVSEAAFLRSQFVISKRGSGGRRYLPCVFTEQGVAMLSGVLRSSRAVQVNIAGMRAFVRLRQTLAAHRELAGKLHELERKVTGHDREIRALFEAIRRLMAPPPGGGRRIGFHGG